MPDDPETVPCCGCGDSLDPAVNHCMTELGFLCPFCVADEALAEIADEQKARDLAINEENSNGIQFGSW